jgi:hypothetical protein
MKKMEEINPIPKTIKEFRENQRESHEEKDFSDYLS